MIIPGERVVELIDEQGAEGLITEGERKALIGWVDKARQAIGDGDEFDPEAEGQGGEPEKLADPTDDEDDEDSDDEDEDAEEEDDESEEEEE